MAMMKAMFPHINNEGKADLKDGQLTFSYVDTRNQSRTDTKPVLMPEEIVSKVQARMDRFASAPYGARESDTSRSERKHIAAHDTHNRDVLRAAWQRMDEDQRMEFEMMLSSSSHEGISDPKEIADSEPTNGPVGDDGKPLDAEGSNSMPAKSVAQRKAVAIAEHHPEQLYSRNKSLLNMSHSQLHDYAATPEKGLPRRAGKKRFKI